MLALDAISIDIKPLLVLVKVIIFLSGKLHHCIFDHNFRSSSRAASQREKKEASKMEKLQNLKRTRDRKRGSKFMYDKNG